MSNPKQFFLRALREVIPFIFVVLFAFLFVSFVGQRTVVNGQSMEGTLHNGESLVLDKMSYNFSEPKRYDIVVFPGVEEDGEHPYYIKRVIGMPGETVQIKDGFVYINGKKLESDIYAKDGYTEDAGAASEPITVPEGSYFCLGDNRQDSRDSRFDVGMVSKKEIVGKTDYRLWPVGEFKIN